MMTEFEVDVCDTSDITVYNKDVMLVTWLCLFLALWQYIFGVTDSSIEILLKFLKVFFSVLSQHINGLTVVASSIPASLYMFHKFLGTSEERFTKYVVCIKCFKLYKVEDAVTSISGVTVSRACDNILFPNHPFSRFRKKCGQVLMTTLVSSSGRKTLVPLKLYICLQII